MKIGIYTRVSTLDKGQNTENQFIELREYCERQGWEIVKEYSDNVSGSKGREKRPQFDKMFDDARLKHFDALLVWSLDRLTREGVSPCFSYISKLDGYGVKFISFREEYLSTMGVWREALIAIMATLARQERLRISERVKSGLERVKAEGGSLGRPAGQSRKHEAKIRLLREDGLSIRKIAITVGVNKSTVERVLAAA